MPVEVVVIFVLLVLFIGAMVAITAVRRHQLAPVFASNKVRSTGTVIVPAHPEAAAGAVRHAMHLVGMKEVPPTAGHLHAHTNTTLWSWGERISVSLQPGPHGTAVTAQSTPLLATALVDFGVGQRNVELLLRKVYELTTGAPVR